MPMGFGGDAGNSTNRNKIPAIFRTPAINLGLWRPLTFDLYSLDLWKWNLSREFNDGIINPDSPFFVGSLFETKRAMQYTDGTKKDVFSASVADNWDILDEMAVTVEA